MFTDQSTILAALQTYPSLLIVYEDTVEISSSLLLSSEMNTVVVLKVGTYDEAGSMTNSKTMTHLRAGAYYCDARTTILLAFDSSGLRRVYRLRLEVVYEQESNMRTGP